MKQAINIPPINPFMPPSPDHENQVQENRTAVVPCSNAARATAATIRSTAYWKTTMTHSTRATTFSPAMTASPRPTRFRGSVELLNWPAARWAIFGLETLGHYNELVGQHQPASAAVMYSMGFTVSDCHERSPRTRVASQPSERGVPRHDRAADRLQDRVARLQSRTD